MTRFEREMLNPGPKRDRKRKGRTELEKLEASKAKAGLGGDRWKRMEKKLGISTRKSVGFR